MADAVLATAEDLARADALEFAADGRAAQFLEPGHDGAGVLHRLALSGKERGDHDRADKRATGQVVQDCAYLLNVPLYCADTPVPPVWPVFAYARHSFTDPRPFRADAAVEFDSLYDEKCRLLDCHASQFHEWLPWSEGRRDYDVSGLSWEQRKALLGHWLERFRTAADEARDVLVETYGEAVGRAVRHAEAFEQTAYGRRVFPADFRRLFAGLPPET